MARTMSHPSGSVDWGSGRCCLCFPTDGYCVLPSVAFPSRRSGIPQHKFELEVLKSGTILEQVDVGTKTHYTFGRSKDNVDVCLEHPSISRLHAVLQYRDNGSIYIYDCGSTHGVTVNKQKIPANEFVEIRVGDMLGFGASTRYVGLCRG